MPGSHGGPDAKRRAIESLLAGSTIVRAAAVANVHERTLRRWLSDDADFRARLEDSRVDASQRVAAALAAVAVIAVNTLSTLCADTSRPDHVRVAAARAILATGPSWLNLSVLEARIAMVEAMLTQRAGSLRPAS